MIHRLLLALVLLVPATAAAQDTGWEITSFDAAYMVQPNGTIDVVERIAVNFNALERRGIFREIPIRYRRADGQRGTDLVDITLRGVSNDRGEALQTQVTRGDNIRIRIGDPDVTVTGRQVYVVAYVIERGVGFFANHDELYWQVTGTFWPVPILNATARVTIPEGGNASDTTWTAWCYAGSATSNDNARCTAEVVPAQEWRFSTGRLEPGEGLTLVAGFPKGIVAEPTETEKRAAAGNVDSERSGTLWWPLAVPLAVFAAMYRSWQQRGREPHTGSIVPRWRIPEGMRPGIGGTLLDQSADLDDVIATLLDLAVRGYVKIVEVKPPNPFEDLGGGFLGKALKKLGDRKPGWAIERTDKPRTDLVASEREVLEAILEGRDRREMRELHNKFHAKLSGLYRAFYAETVEAGWFVKSPEKVRTRWMLFGIVGIVLGTVAGAAMGNVVLAIALGLSGIIVIGFARAMPQMTPRGARMYSELQGLEEFIRRAEKLELEMHQGPKRTTELFETLLPYAVALDASDVWVDQFSEALTSQPPTWYVGSTPHFHAATFRSSFQSFTSSVSSTMASTPGSSSGGGGGGSVGGGGGGGGGGSW